MKKIMLTLSLLTGFILNCHAEFFMTETLPGSQTFDPQAWLEMVTEVYNSYDALMNDVEIITNLYETLKLAMQEAQNMSFDDLGWDGDWDIRNEITSGVSQVNSKLNKVRRLRDKLNERSIKIGNDSFSFTDLAGFSEHGWEDVATAVDTSISNSRKKWERIATEGMTDEEKQNIWSKYGLSPQNYQMVSAMKHQFEMVSKPVIEGLIEEAEGTVLDADKDGKLLEVLMKVANSTGIPKLIAKIQTLLQKNTAEGVKEVARSMDKVAGMVSFRYVVEQSEKEAKAEERLRLMEDEDLKGNCDIDF